MASIDSGWGYQQYSISDAPTTTYTDSPWGYVSKTLTEALPTEGVSDSEWGTKFFTLAVPHRPFVVARANGTLGRTKVLAYTGTVWK